MQPGRLWEVHTGKVVKGAVVLKANGKSVAFPKCALSVKAFGCKQKHLHEGRGAKTCV